VRRGLALEQLVSPGVRPVPARSGQTFDLEPEFLGRQQGGPAVLGIRVGGHQRQRGQVIAGHPGRVARVDRLGHGGLRRAGRRRPPAFVQSIKPISPRGKLAPIDSAHAGLRPSRPRGR